MSSQEHHPTPLSALRFERAWRALGATHAEAFDVLARRYAEPHRAYHTTEHIAECLAWLDQVDLAPERRAVLEVAVFFHDAVYQPGAPDNEAQSAALLGACAVAAGIPAEVAAHIASLVVSTAQHDGACADAVLLADIDLAILGAAPDRYARFERDVRREYAVFPDAAYRLGRSAVLAGLLAREPLYRTPFLALRLAVRARHNLSASLARLSDASPEE